MDKVKVSVIVPVYNVEKYLIECLDSVINQTFKDIEIICVNDGSTDNSLKILEEYAASDNRIKVLNQENQGLSAARNLGLESVTSKYILFVDSDDRIDLDLIEELFYCIENNPVDAVVYGIQNEATDKKSEEIARKDQIKYEKYFKKKTGIYQVSNKLNDEIVTCAVNKLYKKEIIEKFNLRFLNGIIQEDTDWLWTYFLHCKNYYYLDKNKYHYMRRCTSIMAKRTQSIHILDILKIHINIYKNVKLYKNIKDYKKYLTKWFKRDSKNVFREMNKEYRHKFFEIYREYLKENFSFYLLIKYIGLNFKRKEQ